MKSLLRHAMVVIVLAANLRSAGAADFPAWKHLSTKTGDLEVPNPGKEETSSVVLDIDGDKVNDFVITERTAAPSVVWYRRGPSGWTRYVIEDRPLHIEAGSCSCDIDGDGDPDVVAGGDWQSNEVWWWENPRPDFDPGTPWKRRAIKSSGSPKHHDQISGDFDGDGKEELVFWNQDARKLFLARIPADPRGAAAWPMPEIYSYPGDREPPQRGKPAGFKGVNEHEGLARADIDGDGKLDIVGGGLWLKHAGGDRFTPETIDASYPFSRAAAGQIKKGGRPEVVLVVGDGEGPLLWYEWADGRWIDHKVLDVENGHSLALVDFDGDGNLDIFCAEMRLNGGNPDSKIYILLGDGKGDFDPHVVATGFDCHEAKIADLDGNGSLDILGKPYNWETPRLDIWLNQGRATAAAPYLDRFVWVFGWGLGKDGDVGEIGKVLEASARGGLNGAVLSAGLDTLCKHSPDFFRRLEEVRGACEKNGLEVIPALFSVGYGGGVLAHDRNLAEGLPVEDAPFIAQGGEARLVPDREARLTNGDFEAFDGNRMKVFEFHDKPGVTSFVDTQVFHGGKASLRLENFKADPYGHGRVMQEVKVRPRRCYRVSLWVKTEGLEPAGAFRMLALVKDREIAPRSFHLPPAGDWRKVTMLVNSLGFDSIRLYAGVWGAKGGKLWLDDWTLEEIGPLNVLRRAGTPVTVRNDDGSVAYAEGKDFAPLEDPRFDFYRIDRDPPPLRILPGGRIQEGQRLRVSWFHPMVIHDSQITVCMAAPELEEIWGHEARLLSERLHPRRIFLNMDEIRMGGTCLTCRGKDMGVLLGECIAREARILRRFNPGAEIYIWSDMLDPNHNAHGDYYLVEGDFKGSWNHVPKDLILAVWGGEPREKSLRFFSEEGFRSLIACYYDADDLKDVEGWIGLAKGTLGVRGFMYTPWQKKYALLGPFAELLKRR